MRKGTDDVFDLGNVAPQGFKEQEPGGQIVAGLKGKKLLTGFNLTAQLSDGDNLRPLS